MRDIQGSESIIKASICYASVLKKSVVRGSLDPKLTKTQMDIMVILHKDGPLNMSDISNKLFVTREQVTRSVKTLKELGLVTSKRGEEDGRNMTSSLTSEGLDYISKQRKLSRLLVDEYLDSLPEEDQVALIECSTKAVEIFKRNGDFPGRQ